MPVPVWKLTRTPLGRRVFEGLANMGVVLSRLAQFERELGGPLPVSPPPAGIDLRIDAPEAVALSGRMDRPELTDRDRVVPAWALLVRLLVAKTAVPPSGGAVAVVLVAPLMIAPFHTYATRRQFAGAVVVGSVITVGVLA